MPTPSATRPLLAAALLLTGCANPGPPRPPALNLPTPVADLRAERIGNAVHLSWTTPADTTDDLLTRGPVTAVLCRTEPTAPEPAVPGPATPPATAACTWSQRLPVTAGPSAATDPLSASIGPPPTPLPGAPTSGTAAPPTSGPAAPPTSGPAAPPTSALAAPPTSGPAASPASLLPPVSPSPLGLLTQDPPRLLRYTVRLENSAGHSAEPSPPALAASGLAPPPVASFAVTARPGGAQLAWRPDPTPGLAVHLTRTQPGPGRPGNGVPEHATTGTRPAFPPRRQRRHRPTDPISPAPASGSPAGKAVHLLAAPAGRPDPGGTLDLTAPLAVPLTWRAERVRTVTLAGLALALHSDPAPSLTATLTDTFPPASPTGLVAVDGTSPAGPAVDLSWEPNPERDLAGYLVERAASPDAASPSVQGDPASWRSLTPTPLPAQAFHDPSAQPGVAYRYRVSAVDRAGNRSAPTPSVTISVPMPPHLP